MNALSMPFRQLVDRKLWPLAILLIAALAAVPMLLAKEDTTVPTPPAGLGAGATQVADASSVTQPIVTLGEPAQRERRRKVLGASKDPFEPAVKAKKAETTTTTTTTTAGNPGTTGKTGGSGPTTGPVVGVGPVTEPAKKKTYELFSLKIRFGPTSGDKLANRSIKRLTALPKMSEPVLVYLGLKKDLKTAVFLVDTNTMVVGDGKCLPSPTNCQNLELKKGQVAFVDVLDDDGQTIDQYELDFVKVLKKSTSNAQSAKAARRAVAKGGRSALRANISRVNGWKFDPETGVLIPPDGE